MESHSVPVTAINLTTYRQACRPATFSSAVKRCVKVPECEIQWACRWTREIDLGACVTPMDIYVEIDEITPKTCEAWTCKQVQVQVFLLLNEMIRDQRVCLRAGVVHAEPEPLWDDEEAGHGDGGVRGSDREQNDRFVFIDSLVWSNFCRFPGQAVAGRAPEITEVGRKNPQALRCTCWRKTNRMFASFVSKQIY